MNEHADASTRPGPAALNGWTAMLGMTEDAAAPWQPALQLNHDYAEMDIWFATRAECEQWIRQNVLGVGMAGDES